MSVLKFRLNQSNMGTRYPELKKAYVTGLDRAPGRTQVELRPHLLICKKEACESGRIFLPWPVDGFGMPMVGTATLVERDQPYDLAVELARGKLNDVRNQLADWRLMGLKSTADLDALIHTAQATFAKAATSQDDPAASLAASQECLIAAHRASMLLVETYTNQVLHKRLGHASKLSTLVATEVTGDPRSTPYSHSITRATNAAVIGQHWRDLAPVEGKYRWDDFDLQLAWCRRRRLTPIARPILEFRNAALPDWLWLWEGDFDAIVGMIGELVKQAVHRYRGKIPIWRLIGRPATNDVLGLSEEQQIQITAYALQTAREIAPNTQFIIDFDRPWAEWMGSRNFQLGPLHVANSLAQADLNLAGIGLEIAPGFDPPGSHLHEILDFSRMLDLYALINLPLHVTVFFPSSSKPDSQADQSIKVDTRQWGGDPTEESQRQWAARWVSLAVAKPFVKSVTIAHAGDAQPHVFPNSGLMRHDFSPKPIFEWLKAFRTKYIE